MSMIYVRRITTTGQKKVQARSRPVKNLSSDAVQTASLLLLILRAQTVRVSLLRVKSLSSDAVQTASLLLLILRAQTVRVSLLHVKSLSSDAVQTASPQHRDQTSRAVLCDRVLRRRMAAVLMECDLLPAVTEQVVVRPPKRQWRSQTAPARSTDVVLTE